jgi:WD40 repeat protein
VRSVAFSPDGKQVLIGSADGAMRLWETDSRKLHSTLQDPIYSETGAVYSISGTTYVDSNSVTCMALESHGWEVLSGSEGGAVRLWEADSHNLLATSQHSGSVSSVAFSADDRLVETCDEHGRVFPLARE